MIPQAYITEWANQAPWQTNEQVEQDLVICRALVEIFSDEWLASSLAFRGGTALHKLYLQPQSRYSEDIDLVQIRPEPIKETIQRLQARLTFLGDCTVAQKANNNTIKYRFESEFPPVQNLRLKVETNCREHFTVLGYTPFPFQVTSSWFTGSCNITTYKLEELLGTKLRALYQRRKGRAWACLKRPSSPPAAKKYFLFFNSNKKLQSNFLLELKKENKIPCRWQRLVF